MIRNLHRLTSLRLVKVNPVFVYSSLLLGLLGGFGSAQYKIDPRLEELIEKQTQGKTQGLQDGLIQDDFVYQTSIISPDGTVKNYIPTIIYTTNAEQLKKDGFLIQSVSKNFVTALVTSEDIEKLRTNIHITSVNLPTVDYLTNIANVAESGAALLHSGSLNNTQYTGKNVLVGIYDTGIDFTHPDFIDPITKKSRIVRIWDQTISPIEGENSPQLYESANTGVEYTQDHINDEIDGSPTNYVRQRDSHGHGTHVAGTAAGNGSGLKDALYKGMAPEADIVVVKGGNGSFSNTNTIAALDYFKKVSNDLGKPIVVNMSIGGQSSTHDGNSTHEIKVNEFTESGPGKVVVISAGNEGNGNIHQRIDLAPNEKKVIKIEIGANKSNNTASLFSFLAFTKGFKETSTITAKLTCPNGTVLTQAPGGTNTVRLKDAEEKEYQTVTLRNYVDSGSGKRFVDISATRITTKDTQGIYELEIENTSTNPVTIDGWLTSTNYNLASIFLPEGDNNYTVGSPGAATNAITVANYVGSSSMTTRAGSISYNTNLTTQDLNPSSSKGPRIDEVRKPDIAGDGTFVISSHTSSVAATSTIDGKYYTAMTGTSMSSPAVAGGVALLLQANNSLNFAGVKNRLIENATKDQFTSNDYTTKFGYGKLNVYKAVDAELRAINNNTSCQLSNFVNLGYDNYGNTYATSNELLGNRYNIQSDKRVAVKYTPTITGKLNSVYAYLGYNASSVAAPFKVEIRKSKNGAPDELLGTKTFADKANTNLIGWNNLDFSDLNINVTYNEDFFVVIYAENTNFDLYIDRTNIDNRTFISNDYGLSFYPQSDIDLKVRAIIYENETGVKQLASTSKQAQQAVGLGTSHFVNGCELIASVESSGAAPVTGNTTAKVWIDSKAKEFVQRRVEINNESNNTASTGKVKLYFTQADFDAFNQNSAVKLPTSPTDTENMSHLHLYYFAGTSNDNTGTPASYTNAPVITNVDASNIVWNKTYNYWEITTDAVGFGGFLVSSTNTLSTIDTTLNNLAVYPNPVESELNITLPNNIKDASYKVVNLAGQTVASGNVYSIQSKVNLSHLAQGVYIIEIKTEKGAVTKKLLKK